MIYLCLDTCTWIYLANGFEPGKLLGYLEDQVMFGNINIILPNIVVKEWEKNRDGAIIPNVEKLFKECTERLEKIKQLIGNHTPFDDLLASPERQKDFEDEENLLKFFDLFQTKKDFFKIKANENIKAIERIFANQSTIKTNFDEKIMTEASTMALKHEPPFTKKNSMADALIFLQYIDFVLKKNIQGSYFISGNTQDFGVNNTSQLHPNLHEKITLANGRFFTSLARAIYHIEKDVVTLEEVKEIERKKRQIQEEEEFDDYYCLICQQNSSRATPLHFNHSTEVHDERPFKDYNQLSLFEDENVFENGRLINPFEKEFLEEAACSYCGTEHIKCPECGEIMEFLEDKNFNERERCDGCGVHFMYKLNYGRKGDIDSTEFIIYEDLMFCAGCGDEFEYRHDNSNLCEDCEERYAMGDDVIS